MHYFSHILEVSAFDPKNKFRPTQRDDNEITALQRGALGLGISRALGLGLGLGFGSPVACDEAEREERPQRRPIVHPTWFRYFGAWVRVRLG